MDLVNTFPVSEMARANEALNVLITTLPNDAPNLANQLMNSVGTSSFDKTVQNIKNFK